jgi:hypothetical protein
VTLVSLSDDPQPLLICAATYRRPDLPEMLEKIRRVRLTLRLTLNAASAVQAVEDLQTCLRPYLASRSLARLLHERNAGDPVFCQEMDFFLQADAKVWDSLSQALQAVVACRFKNDLMPRLAPLSPEIMLEDRGLSVLRTAEERQAEKRLVLEQQDFFARSRIFCLGQRWPLAALPSFLESPQESIRQAAWRGLVDFWQAHAETQNEVMRKLLEIRSQAARKLHLASPFELACRQAGLEDLQPENLEAFRQNVLRYLVPMTGEIRRLQRKRLNEDSLKPWNWLCLLPAGYPVPAAGRNELGEATCRILRQVLTESGRDQSDIVRLLSEGVADYQLLPDMYAAPAAFVLGDDGPVYWRVIHHGCLRDLTAQTRACASLLRRLNLSAGGQKVSLSTWPRRPDDARDALLAGLTEWTWLPCWAPVVEDTSLHTLLRLTQWVEAIVWLTLVAEFAQKMQDGRLSKAEERAALWQDLQKKYAPDLDLDQIPFLEKGGLLQAAPAAWLWPAKPLAQAFGMITALAVRYQNARTPAGLPHAFANLLETDPRLTYRETLEKNQWPEPWDETLFRRLAYAISAELAL